MSKDMEHVYGNAVTVSASLLICIIFIKKIYFLVNFMLNICEKKLRASYLF